MKKVIEKFKRYGIIKTIGNNRRLISEIKNYFLIILGTFVCAVGINVFFVPGGIVAGGVSGVALIFNKLTGFSMGIFMLFLNIPLFFAGVKIFGGAFGVKTLVGTLLLSVFIELTDGISSVSDDLMLCALFGGVSTGAGMGVVFFSGATSGGTDVLARLLNKKLPLLNVGKWLFVTDFFIIFAGAAAFGNFELSLYGIIALFISAYMVDLLLAGIDFAKIVYIISPENEKIADFITNKLNRGVTGIYSRGIYKKTDAMMLMCVVKHLEVKRLKEAVKNIDPDAFVILSQAREVKGEGFKKYSGV